MRSSLHPSSTHLERGNREGKEHTDLLFSLSPTHEAHWLASEFKTNLPTASLSTTSRPPSIYRVQEVGNKDYSTSTMLEWKMQPQRAIWALPSGCVRRPRHYARLLPRCRLPIAAVCRLFRSYWTWVWIPPSRMRHACSPWAVQAFRAAPVSPGLPPGLPYKSAIRWSAVRLFMGLKPHAPELPSFEAQTGKPATCWFFHGSTNKPSTVVFSIGSTKKPLRLSFRP